MTTLKRRSILPELIFTCFCITKPLLIGHITNLNFMLKKGTLLRAFLTFFLSFVIRYNARKPAVMPYCSAKVHSNVQMCKF